MNYEDLYQELQPIEKAAGESLASLQKLFKAIKRERESGDLKSLSRDLHDMETAAASLSDALHTMQKRASDFDMKAYVQNGDFAEQMLSACAKAGVDVRGEFPVYEMFPYKVKLDTETQDIYLDRKRIQCLRPDYFATLVREGQERLNKASFNAQSFANELSDAYDLALLKLNKRAESDIYLNTLHKFLTPMSRFRRDYDSQSFAFDIARLYASGVTETKSGRSIQYGPSRHNGKAIRILKQDGKEEFLATIRFFKKDHTAWEPIEDVKAE